MLTGILDLALTVCAFLVAIGIVVFVHELGHFVAARLSGIEVKTFSVGFGRALVSWRDSKGVVWKIGILPLGGYVRFAEVQLPKEAGRTADSLAADSLSVASLGSRFLTVLAGPFANFLLSIAVFSVLALSIGMITGDALVGTVKDVPGARVEVRSGDLITAVDGQPIESIADLYSFPEPEDARIPVIYTVVRDGSIVTAAGPVPMPPIIDSVRLMSAAFDSGLEVGDVVLAIDGSPVGAFDELRTAVEKSAGRELDLLIWRDGEELNISVAAREESVPLPDGSYESRMLLGINGGLFFEPQTVTPSIADAVLNAAARTAFVVTGTVDGVTAIVARQISACNLQGPVGIARVTGQAASQGMVEFISLIAIISTVIGFLNLLPIPGLDGGHIAFYLYEVVVGRAPNSSFQRVAVTIGFALVALLMAFGLFNDLTC